MNPLEMLVRRLASQSELDEADRRAVLDLPCTVRMLDPSSYVMREGEAPQQCGMMVSGFAYRHKLTADGSRQIVSVHIAGDPLDFQSMFLDVADHNVQTLTRAEIAFVPRDRLQQLVRTNPAVARAVLVNLLVDSSIFREWILNVGRRDARARLAHLLCELAARLESIGLMQDHAYELPMTQEQLGDALGLTAVHVNRTLKALEAGGLIVRDRRFVGTSDWMRLRDIAGFNARYLHLERQKTGADAGR